MDVELLVNNILVAIIVKVSTRSLRFAYLQFCQPLAQGMLIVGVLVMGELVLEGSRHNVADYEMFKNEDVLKGESMLKSEDVRRRNH